MSFEFKKFKINHHVEVFKFGTDAALLATWVNIEQHKSILEIGTGSGVITLIMAQRNPKAQFTGIDISEAAIELANHNLSQYPIKADITFIHKSLQDFETSLKFDHIVSNPPFFENATKSPYALKNTTRHTDTLSLKELLLQSKELLNPTGVISMVYPVRYLEDIKRFCIELELHIQEIVFTRSTVNKPIKRVLINIGLKPIKTVESELIINGDHHGYSEEIYKRFEPFYLKL